MNSEWFFLNGTTKHGPYTSEALKQMLKDSLITHDTLIWKKGMEDWSILRSVCEFSTDIQITEQKVSNPTIVITAQENLNHTYDSNSQHDQIATQSKGLGRLVCACILIPIFFAKLAFYPMLGGTSYVYSLLTLVTGLILMLPIRHRLNNIGRNPAWSLLLLLPLLELIVIFQCILLPTGYAQHRKLDKAAKFIVAAFAVISGLAVKNCVKYMYPIYSQTEKVESVGVNSRIAQDRVAEIIDEQVSLINRSMPIQVDNDYRIDQITSDSKYSVTYHCTVLKFYNYELDIESFKNNNYKNLSLSYQQNEGFKTFLDHKVILNYKYVDKAGNPICTISIDPNKFSANYTLEGQKPSGSSPSNLDSSNPQHKKRVYNFTDEWYAAKSACWQKVIAKYPDSGVNGSAFRNRMFEIDEWAEQNNPDLYSNSEKPMIYAEMVYEEMMKSSR